MMFKQPDKEFTKFEIRDPVHGFCYLSDFEQKIIDKPVFQRLRDIKQLWPVNLIYPGALHTRFEHSIGVCHIVGLIASSFKLDPDEQIALRLAGLLHDIGHGPFSHVSEDAIMQKGKFSSSRTKKDLKKHEQESTAIIEELLHNTPYLEKVLSITLGNNTSNLGNLFMVISGPIDCDNLDYLLRDSYYCGVEYGKFDINRLIGSFRCIGVEDERNIAVDEEYICAIEQFALARYYMWQQVYSHKTTFKAEKMFARAISLGVKENIPEVKKYYSENQSWINIKDTDIINMVCTNSNSKFGRCLSKLLVTRKIAKTIYQKEFPSDHEKIISSKSSEIEEVLSRELALKYPEEAIVCFEKSKPIIKSGSDESILEVVTTKNDKPTGTLGEKSLILSSIANSNTKKPVLKILVSSDDWENRYGSIKEAEASSSKAYIKDQEIISAIIAEVLK